MIATTTVTRSRLRSITDDRDACAPNPPPNMSDSPPPLPLCKSTKKINESAERIRIGATNQTMAHMLPDEYAIAPLDKFVKFLSSLILKLLKSFEHLDHLEPVELLATWT